MIKIFKYDKIMNNREYAIYVLRHGRTGKMGQTVMHIIYSLQDIEKYKNPKNDKT
jgi:hypothetical protein